MKKYFNPVEIIFGQNKFKKIDELLKNKKYIVITHKNITTRYATELRNSNNPPLEIIKNINPNPDYLHLLSLQEKFSTLEKEIDYIVAIGGGSVIDTAKVLAAFKSNKKYLEDFIRSKKKPIVNNTLKIVAIPTTSGSSSELTCWATIWDYEKKSKYSLSHKTLYPRIAILDPLLTITKTKKLTISTGLDALSHSLESIWNINANPISSSYAIPAAKLIINNLPLLINDLKNIKLRSSMVKACIKAGLAFFNTKTAIAHNLSYPITLEFGIQHGIASSFSLPFILRSLIDTNEVVEKNLKEIFGENLVKGSKELSQFLKKLGVPQNLNELKIDNNKWNQIVDQAFAGERGKNFTGNKKNFTHALNLSNFF